MEKETFFYQILTVCKFLLVVRFPSFCCWATNSSEACRFKSFIKLPSLCRPEADCVCAGWWGLVVQQCEHQSCGQPSVALNVAEEPVRLFHFNFFRNFRVCVIFLKYFWNVCGRIFIWHVNYTIGTNTVPKSGHPVFINGIIRDILFTIMARKASGGTCHHDGVGLWKLPRFYFFEIFIARRRTFSIFFLL